MVIALVVLAFLVWNQISNSDQFTSVSQQNEIENNQLDSTMSKFRENFDNNQINDNESAMESEIQYDNNTTTDQPKYVTLQPPPASINIVYPVNDPLPTRWYKDNNEVKGKMESIRGQRNEDYARFNQDIIEGEDVLDKISEREEEGGEEFEIEYQGEGTNENVEGDEEYEPEYQGEGTNENGEGEEDLNDIYELDELVEGTDMLVAHLLDKMYYTNSIANVNKNATHDLRGDIAQPKKIISPWMNSSYPSEPKTSKRLFDDCEEGLQEVVGYSSGMAIMPFKN